MDEHTPTCEDCSHQLFELKGEFFCPSCDSVSGFELVPDEQAFRL